MFKVKVVALDIIGNALTWLDANGDEEHMELCEIITLDDDSPVPIWDLPLYDNWDILLVFEKNFRSSIEGILEKLGIPEDRIIYPMDMEGSLAKNAYISSYIFGDQIRKALRYLSYREAGSRYALGEPDGMTYVNVSTDDIILPNMLIDDKNWSDEEMVLFYDLAKKYFTFNEKQDLFCDIGANIGTTCIYFKKRIDGDVHILAFEPSYENHKLLCVNALLNDLDLSEHLFVRKGLSDKNSSALLNYDAGNPGASSVIMEKSDVSDEIELVTLDSYLEKNGISSGRIKYIWVDVEGFEGRFLVGARDTLGKINVPVIMEFTPYFYSKRDGEFELLMDEMERNFDSFICLQHTEWGKLPVSRLRKEKDNLAIQWDLFLIKDAG
ncbi:MAG: FkbM family methyltransferase [Lachnospiraceae bacterium]|nr:FkbM family methyltransferase [Lachnospiraceae bacterium]